MCFRRQTGAGASELPQNLMWPDATLDFNIHSTCSYQQDSGKSNIVMEHLAGCDGQYG